jgi:predicted TIM-barrel fold metal-dependent hydrolase
MLASVHGERLLVYGSDYPHWQAKSPDATLLNASDEIRSRILRDNALELFGERLSPQSAAR